MKTGISVQKLAFKARVREWAATFGVQIVWLGVRPMRNKWASCSTNGHLNFSDELLGLDRELWDCVIVHELLHFTVPNHGKLWQSLMRAHLGDYESAELRLRRARGSGKGEGSGGSGDPCDPCGLLRQNSSAGRALHSPSCSASDS